MKVGKHEAKYINGSRTVFGTNWMLTAWSCVPSHLLHFLYLISLGKYIGITDPSQVANEGIPETMVLTSLFDYPGTQLSARIKAFLYIERNSKL